LLCGESLSTVPCIAASLMAHSPVSHRDRPLLGMGEPRIAYALLACTHTLASHALNHSTRDSYTCRPRHTAITRFRVLSVYQCSVARFRALPPPAHWQQWPVPTYRDQRSAVRRPHGTQRVHLPR